MDPDKSGYPQTWRALFGVLEQLGLQELSQQVEGLLMSKCLTSFHKGWYQLKFAIRVLSILINYS